MTLFLGCFGAPRSFRAPLDGLASRSRGSDQLPGHDWLRDHLANVARVKRLGTFPKVIPTGPWILGGLKRVLAGTPKLDRSGVRKNMAASPYETLLLFRSRAGKDARGCLGSNRDEPMLDQTRPRRRRGTERILAPERTCRFSLTRRSCSSAAARARTRGVLQLTF